jgi:hypothetical protein
MQSGCSSPASIDRAPNTLSSLANLVQPKASCPVSGQNVVLTAEECRQAREEAKVSDENARQQAMEIASRTRNNRRNEQQRRDAVIAQAIRDEAARGYRAVTFRDVFLDGKIHAENDTKVSISGFYKLYGRHNQRLHSSYDAFMMQKTQNIEPYYIGLITEDASRNMRDYLLRCVGGCNVTILGRIGRCVENNIFGRMSQDVCVIAEDMRLPENQ